MKIALVVGHRRLAQGAYGNAGISEFNFNSRLVSEMLKHEKLDTDKNEFRIFHREDDLNGYTERMKHLHKKIDAWGAKASVSFHFNAVSNPQVTGHEILYHSKRGKQIARQLDFYFDMFLGNRDRGIKHRTKKQRGGGFLARGRSVCLIAEPFFASHQSDFVTGQPGRENLLDSYIEFFNKLKIS